MGKQTINIKSGQRQKPTLLNKDIELTKRLKNPKQKDKAFKDLLDLYQERLYWHIRKIVLTHDNANDVLQNTFIRVYKGIQNFKEKSTLTYLDVSE